jgi:signal peptidase II
MNINNLKKSGACFLLVSLATFLIDWLSKTLIAKNIVAYDHSSFIPVIRNFFRIVHVHNEGAAFSFLAEHSGWQQWFFGITAVAISAFLIWKLFQNTANKVWSNVSYALIIGGALGNLYDRFVYGYVIDFLDFYIVTDHMEYHYPSFNIADCAVCVGVFMVLVYEIFLNKNTTLEK